MCKLCNTDREPYYPKDKNANGNNYTQEFRALVNDYIGENPCSACCDSYRGSLYKCNINAEDFILRKLLYSYTHIKDRKSFLRKQYYKQVMTSENAGKNITKKTNTKTEISFYSVMFGKRLNKKIVTVFIKNTKTLEEAIEVRNNYLKGVN